MNNGLQIKSSQSKSNERTFGNQTFNTYPFWVSLPGFQIKQVYSRISSFKNFDQLW